MDNNQTIMTMSEPLAFFLTWTCYGTWFHGDKRGSVDDEHNAPRTPFLSSNSKRVAIQKSLLRHAPIILNKQGRSIVEETIIAHCNHREWEILALDVRTNHVHVVLHAADVSPEQMMGQLKAWSTRRLREAGYVSSHARVWTHHGSTRYLWNETSINKSVGYVTDHQGEDLE